MTREIFPIPDEVREALRTHNCITAFRARPPYQQNEYIGWITGAKTVVTQQKRLELMLRELKEGNRYMNMVWKG